MKTDSKVLVPNNWKGVGRTSFEGNIRCTSYGCSKFRASISHPSENTK